jgi:hypothetical protein
MDMTRYEMETLRDQIASLTKLQHIEIFKVLKRLDVKYTENNDGVFIFCSHIPHRSPGGDQTILRLL